MPYKYNLIHHVKSVYACLPRFRAVATIDYGNFAMEVRARNRYYQFHAQFAYREEGRLRFSPQLTPNARGFVGWLPYFNKRWDAAIDKLSFKQFCVTQKLNTPPYWLSGPEKLRDIIIKPRKASFAVGIRGPFREIDGSSPAHALREGEYYERYVSGQIAKAWYWNGKLVCLELREMPSVTGDGTSALRQLADAQRSPALGEPEWDSVDTLLEFQGASLVTVPSPGKQFAVDFRYGSALYPMNLENSNVLAQYSGTTVAEQLGIAGPICLQAIPGAIRPQTVFSLDAIVDSNNIVWLLEMNCNPTLHPDIYLPMFEALFGPPEPVRVGNEQVLSVGYGSALPGLSPAIQLPQHVHSGLI